jgi:hypothetical protein
MHLSDNMSDKCKKCGESVFINEDYHVLCKHHKSLVHFKCCVESCSQDSKPCNHCLGIFNLK